MRIARTVVGLLACSFAAVALGVDPPATTGTLKTEAKATAIKSYRASKLIGLNVKNEANEKVGTIDDFVVDMHSGKVNYAAMSVGGFLGIGDKLFAVPFEQMRFHHDMNSNEMYFVFDVSKERLQNAPGFDKNHWPDAVDKHWLDVDIYYRRAQTTTPTTR